VDSRIIEDLKAAHAKGGLEAFRSLLDEKANGWKKTSLDVAVIGRSGVGKSSYINAIRGMTAEDKGAAPVGVTETTKQVRSYPHPGNKKLRLWDVPGFNTKQFTRAEYLSKIEVDRFDFFLLMTSDSSFSKNDIWLINELRKRDKKYYYVRTKIAEAVANDKKAHPRTHREATVVKKIRASTARHLKEERCDNIPIFLIDNYELQKFDFKKLKLKLIEDLPDLQKSVLIFSLQANSERMIRLKVDELRSRIWKKSLLSAGAALVSVPGLSNDADMAIVASETKFYFKQLCLDNESLRRYCRDHSVNYDKVRSIVDSYLGITADTVNDEVWTTAVQRIVKSSATSFLAATGVAGPAGFVMKLPASYIGTYQALQLVLKKFEDAAVEVMKLIAEDAANTKDSEEDTNGSKDAGNLSGSQESVIVNNPPWYSQLWSSFRSLWG